jgi:hypothetical protein
VPIAPTCGGPGSRPQVPPWEASSDRLGRHGRPAATSVREFMPRNQDRQHREAESLGQNFRSQWTRLEPERQLAAEVDQAPREQAATVQRALGPWFEPDQPDPAPAATGGQVWGSAQVKAPRRWRWLWLLMAWAMTLAMAGLLGFAVGSVRAASEPTRATAATRPPATRPAPVPSPSVVVRATASSACLETARRADEMIHLLIRNRRDQAAELLVAYTVASRQCRRDADP